MIQQDTGSWKRMILVTSWSRYNPGTRSINNIFLKLIPTSHVRNSFTSCELPSHCVSNHKELVGADKLYDLQEVKQAFKFILLESLGNDKHLDDLKKREDLWRTRLESWAPVGLNVRHD